MTGALLAAANTCAADTAFHVNSAQAAILGLTQGLTEFIPVSSSGHLIIVPWAFGWKDVYCAKEGNKFFDVALHIGTFVGAALYLRRDVRILVRAFFSSLATRSVRTHEQRMAWYLVLATIPAALVGAALEGPITEHLGKPWQIAVLLAAFGLLLYVVDRRVEQRTLYTAMTRNQALGMGVAQALALAPGVSRSGATITAARAMGVSRDGAARFSFLLSLPITLGAALYTATKLGDTGGMNGQAGQFAVGVLCSGISGAFAVWGVLRLVRTRSYGDFAVYRVAAAAAILLAIATGVRPGVVLMPTLVLVRHGLTELTGPVLAGWTPGVDLDERGRAQAAAVADRLRAVPFAAIVSSPLERCAQTAAALAAGRELSVTVDDRVGEARYGDWTGGQLKSLARDPLWRRVQAHPSAVTFPAGESLRATSARAVDAVRDWNERLGDAATYAIVSHGDVIKAVVADALGLHLDMFQRIQVDPCSVTVIRYTELRPFLVRLNDVGALSDLLPAKRKGRRRRGSSDAPVGGGAGAQL